ncbi:MAG: LysE family transporter [Gammaproteobacteria bacterium]|nr:LysE family transporter [Gammaproteobacteria bacterium]
MDLTLALLAMTAAFTLGAMIPGPSFLLVARTALAVSRPAGLAAALGMGLGGVVFAVVALLGLMALLAAVPVLYGALKLVGGLYLLSIGWRIVRGARQPLVMDSMGQKNNGSLWRAFALALATQLSNPKTALAYAGIFASLLPREVPLAVTLALPVLVFVIEFGWYALVTLVLSAPGPRARYLAGKVWIDRIAGSLMGLLGIKLLADVAR